MEDPAFRYVELPALGAAPPKRGGAATRALARAALRLLRFRLAGRFPDVPQFVMLGAPHTSNWDGVVSLVAALAIGLEVNVLAKHTLFRPPLGPVLRWLGGVPLDRTSAGGVVEAAVSRFRSGRPFVLSIAPEGTRKHAGGWKSGFHRIAVGAGVPVVAVAFDWGRRTIGPVGTVVMTGDWERDLAAVRACYAGVRGRYPERQTL